MTNYNGRLDEIIADHREWMRGIRTDHLVGTSSEATKQAITSLFKELVTEAKPEKKSTEDYGSWEEGHRNAGWNNCLEHYEQNLLKALEEAK